MPNPYTLTTEPSAASIAKRQYRFADLSRRDVVDAMLARGAALLPSFSGGADSQAMLEVLASTHRLNVWPGPIRAGHADLGRAEWPQTPGHVRFVCDRLGIPLTVVKRPQGDLLSQIQARHETLLKRGGGVPPFPDAKNRTCTSDQKRAQLDKLTRALPAAPGEGKNPWPTATMRFCTADHKRDQLAQPQRKAGGLVVVAMGFRADESAARSKRPVVSVNKRLSSKALVGLTPEDALAAWTPKQRLVIDWLPIHDWTKADVWRACGASPEELEARRLAWRTGDQERALLGWPAHPAYVMGNERLSCALCILGCNGDLENGARAVPEVLKAYIQIEIESGFTFKNKFSLRSLKATRDLFPALYVGAQQAAADKSGQIGLGL